MGIGLFICVAFLLSKAGLHGSENRIFSYCVIKNNHGIKNTHSTKVLDFKENSSFVQSYLFFWVLGFPLEPHLILSSVRIVLVQTSGRNFSLYQK
jgi:hypothetical protein